jgi:hypothetical protein
MLMRTYLSLLFVALLFIGAGCDGIFNPNSDGRDTVWVIDSGLSKSYRLSGRVTLQNNCDREVNHSGVVVTIIATGESTVTDDSGYYSFSKVIRPRDGNQAVLAFSKPGFYSHSPIGFDLVVKADSNAYLLNSKLFRHHNYTAQFISGPIIDSQKYYITKDTLVFNTDSVLVKLPVIIDSAYSRSYIFTAIGINELGQKTSVAQVMPLISRTATFDHLDMSSVLFSYYISSGYPTRFGLSVDHLMYHGLKSGDTVFVSVTSAGECMTGWTPGLQKATPIPVVLR